jgi:hypothetical protein
VQGFREACDTAVLGGNSGLGIRGRRFLGTPGILNYLLEGRESMAAGDLTDDEQA